MIGAAGDAHWIKIKSPNFELYTTTGERSGREVARHFEQVRAFFIDSMGLGPKSGPPVRIVVFRSDKEYAPYSPNEYASAFYQSVGDRDYIVMKSAASEQFPVAVHEYTHLLVRHTGIAPPVWFNEGLAEFYSNLKPLGGKIEVGSIIPSHYRELQQSKWIDLATLLDVGHDSPLYNEKNHAGLFYSESWALVHMLYLGTDYRPKLPVLLEGIKAGVSMPELFAKAYGKGVPQVQKDLAAYMRGATFNASLFSTKLTKETDELESTESSALDAELVLGDIVASTIGKNAAARELYARLAADNPKDWRIESGLARLSMMEGKRDEALAHYARAVELGSDSPRMFLDYGRLLRSRDQHAEAVTVLRRATGIDPSDRDAQLELGYAYLTDGQYPEALAQFKMVKSVTEAQAFGYFHGMAYAYYRLDRLADAKAAASTCRKYAKSGNEIERIDQLVEAINYVPRYPLLGGDSPHAGPGGPPPETTRIEPSRIRRATALAVAEGTLRRIDCEEGKIRIEIAVGADSMSFSLNPASAITKSGKPMDFTCGPQTARRIRIEYEAKPDKAAAGVVRIIDFPD